MRQRSSNSWLNQAQKWFRTYVIQEVPAHVSVCEFDCNEIHCNRQKWLNCSKLH